MQCLHKFGRKWGTECLNTRFPLPTLLCAGYSVKLNILYFKYYSVFNGGGEIKFNSVLGNELTAAIKQAMKENTRTSQLSRSHPELSTACHQSGGNDFFLYNNVISKIFFVYFLNVYKNIKTVRGPIDAYNK